MPGIIWYVALGVIGLCSAAVMLCRSRDKGKLIFFYLLAIMAADTGEILAMMIFRSYAYIIGISSDYMVDNIVGHVIPNSTLWPATGILIFAYCVILRASLSSRLWCFWR